MLGAVALVDSAIVLIVGGGLNTGTILPGALGAALCLWALARARQWPFAVGPHWRRERHMAYFAAGLFAISFLVVQSFIWSAALRGPRQNGADWLIVLGAGLRGDHPSKTLLRRLDTAQKYAEAHPGCRIIVTGGKGFGEKRTEAEVMAEWLVAHGTERGRILLESKATSTMENLRLTRVVLQHEGGPPPWNAAVVTSDFHLFRVRMLARRAGLDLQPVPAPTPWFLLPNACLREYLAVIKSAMIDRG